MVDPGGPGAHAPHSTPRFGDPSIHFNEYDN